MKLTDIRTVDSKDINDVIKTRFGYEIDLKSLTIASAQDMLENIQALLLKSRQSVGSKANSTKEYLERILVAESLEKYIQERSLSKPENKKKEKYVKGMKKNRGDFKKRYGKRGKDVMYATATKMAKEDTTKIPAHAGIKHRDTTPKGERFRIKGVESTALRMLVGAENWALAKRAMEMAKNGKVVPPNYMLAFMPLIDILDDIMASGMANVNLLKVIQKKARRQLGRDKMEAREFMGRKRAIKEQKTIKEDAAGTAEVVLAAKDIVDRLQKQLEDLSTMVNEDLPPLTDTIRSEMGPQEADTYSNTITTAINAALDAIRNSRMEADAASRVLQGEEQPEAFGDDPLGGDDFGGDDLGGDDLGGDDLGGDFDGGPGLDDEFSATDVAVGGGDELGREKREF